MTAPPDLPLVRGDRTILVVDDEEPNRALLAALIGSRGCRAELAHDGPSALARLRQGGIDLVLLDVMMVDMDGLETCRRIRGELALTDLPVVIVTSLSDRASRHEARAAGADDFIVKPIDPFELTTRLDNWLKLTEYRSALREMERRMRRQQHASARLRELTSVSLGAHLHGELLATKVLLDESLDRLNAASLRAADLAAARAALACAAARLERSADGLGWMGADPDPAPIALGALVEGVIQLLVDSGRLDVGDVRLDAACADLRVGEAKSKLARTLVHLLENAKDALAPAPARLEPPICVQVEHRPQAGRVALTVRDHGVGMAEDDLGRVLEPYVSDKRPRGLGLGLTVARAMAESCGGRLQLVSRRGEGTSCTVELPEGLFQAGPGGESA